MENHFPFHKITPLESMIIDLQEFGQEEVWKNIETFNNPFHRIKARILMAKAMKKIEENEL